MLTCTGMLRRAPTTAEAAVGRRERAVQADVVRTLVDSVEHARRVR